MDARPPRLSPAGGGDIVIEQPRYSYGRGKGGVRYHALVNPGGAMCGYMPKSGWAVIKPDLPMFVCRKCRYVADFGIARPAAGAGMDG